MTLRVTFLGTSAAIPTTRRNPSGIFVNREGERLLFDVGEGSQRQMMRYGTGFAVDVIFLTHVHGDHVLGVPGLLQTWDFHERTEPITIYTPHGTGQSVRRFLTTLEGEPSYGITVREVDPGNVVYESDEYEVRAVETDHRAPAVGYLLEEHERAGRFDRERAEELGVPVGPKFSRLHRGETVELEDGSVVEPAQVVGPPRPGRKVLYTGDTRPCDAIVRAATGVDLLIHDATFTEELAERARETAHATAREAGQVAARAEVRRLALTHISSRYTGDEPGHVAEASEVFDGHVVLARDGKEIEVPYPDV